MRIWGFLMASAFLVACDEPKDEMPKRESIIRNLPTNDRAFLLEPLEAAWDDLREITDHDPGLFESSRDIDSAGFHGNLAFKLNGADTVFVHLRIAGDFMTESLSAYWNDEGHLFLLEARISYGQPRVGHQRAYRLYFDEYNALLSAYGKASFDGKTLPNEWRTICPTEDELDYLINRHRQF